MSELEIAPTHLLEHLLEHRLDAVADDVELHPDADDPARDVLEVSIWRLEHRCGSVEAGVNPLRNNEQPVEDTPRQGAVLRRVGVSSVQSTPVQKSVQRM